MQIIELMKGQLQTLEGLYRAYLCLNHMKFQRSDKVLEIGCGAGLTSVLLANKCSQIIATDISSEVISILAERPHPKNVLFQVMDATKEPPSAFRHAFDKVICIDVLEHVDNPQNLLDFMSMVLNNEGVGVLTFPINNGNHGKNYFTREAVLNLATEASVTIEALFFKMDLFGRFLDKLQLMGQHFLGKPPVEADNFKSYTCFQMLSKPKKVYNLYKLAISLMFCIHKKAYHYSEFGDRALLLVKRRATN